MLIITGVMVALIAILIIPRIRVPGAVHPAPLGWMSDQWLAEYRASNST